MSPHQRHGRLGAAIRWNQPEAAELARELAIERAVVALIELRRHHPDSDTRRRLTYLVDGVLSPDVTRDPIAWVLR